MGRRSFLDSNHKWRKNKKCFDGYEEFKVAPIPLLGSTILEKIGEREKIYLETLKRGKEIMLIYGKKKYII